jgi:hypothetical protein
MDDDTRHGRHVRGQRDHRFADVAGRSEGSPDESEIPFPRPRFCAERLAVYKVPESFTRGVAMPGEAGSVDGGAGGLATLDDHSHRHIQSYL